MTGQKYYLTEEKYKGLVSELRELETVRRKEVADSLSYARSLGDLSENAEYQEARESQATLEERIASIKIILKDSEIIKNHHSGVVEPGSQVTLKKEGGSPPQVFYMVGSAEADYNANKISNESPLGKALLGKKKGEKFEFKTPKGSVTYTIVEIV